MSEEQTVEERARTMGWLPQEDFKGDPERWTDAETFLDRGENIMPILKERLGKMEKMLAEKTAKIEQVTSRLTKFAKHHKGTYQRAYKNALKEVEKQKLAAVEAGNTEMYQDAQQREHEILIEQDELVKAEAEAAAEQPIPEFIEFQKNNPWYQTDVAMTAYVDAITPGVAQTATSETDFFNKLAEAARLEFPHKFTPEASTAVEAGSTDVDTGRKSKGKKWADLPPDAKEAYNTEFSNIEGFSKEDYAKDYFEQE